MNLRLLALAALVACAGSKPETRASGRASPEASASAGTPVAPAPAGAAAAPSPGEGANRPDSPSSTATPPRQQPGAQPPGTPARVGKEPQKAAETGTVPAAQASQGGARTTAPAPGLMPEQAFRQTAPTPLAVQPHFVAPVPAQRKLKNGARVLVVENHQIPLVAVGVRFLHGVDADPPDRPGLAEFVADTVDEGTRTRPAEKLAEQIEDLAAHLSTGAGLESATVHLNCLAETLPQALELLADVIQNPAFRKEDVERVRVLKLTQLEQKKASIVALASDEADKLLYGPEHPWGKPSGGTPESVSAISPEELAAFHHKFWVPNNAVISVSGDVKTAQIVPLLEKAFAGWKPRPVPKLSLPKLPPLPGRRIDALDKANATQSQVWVVGRLFPARSSDAVVLRVGNQALGGLFTSRLNSNLREKHGYSYSVRSGLSLLREVGTFTASGGVIAKNTVEAVREYENELEKFSSGDITDAELASSKEAMIRGLPSALETNDAVAGALSNLVSLRLPLDYYKTLPDRIARVSRADVRRAVRRWVKPGAWPVVIVGPVGQSKEQLTSLKLGPVSVEPAPGSAPAAGKPAAVQ